MRILVLGGTAWLGAHIVEAALARGHEVTCLARGESGQVPDAASFVRADRNAPNAYVDVLPAGASPAGETARTDTSGTPTRPGWDLVVDVSRSLAQVRSAVEALEPHATSFTFISSTSAYASQSERGADESASTFPDPEPGTADADITYGTAKAAAERAILAAFGGPRTTIMRPGLIAGPGDHTGRSGYWPLRFSRPASPSGAVLVPDAPDLPTQMVDVRDLAVWVITAAENGVRGTFNVNSTPLSFAEHVDMARAVAGHTGPVVEVSEKFLLAHGVEPWAGEQSLPLWIDDRGWWGMNDRDTSRARAAGLDIRPLADTLRDTLDWELAQPRDARRSAGLTDDRERELLEAWALEAGDIAQS